MPITIATPASRHSFKCWAVAAGAVKSMITSQ
ncbi:hypothetical protein J729_4773, partial [Acinetobacter baumannii 929679-598]